MEPTPFFQVIRPDQINDKLWEEHKERLEADGLCLEMRPRNDGYDFRLIKVYIEPHSNWMERNQMLRYLNGEPVSFKTHEFHGFIETNVIGYEPGTGPERLTIDGAEHFKVNGYWYTREDGERVYLTTYRKVEQ